MSRSKAYKNENINHKNKVSQLDEQVDIKKKKSSNKYNA